MSTDQTRQRILDHAEVLFAQHGFAETSKRQLTAQAKVNLASVNYHFGSKEALVREVLRRPLDRLAAERKRRLDRLEASYREEPLPLEAVLEAFIEPALCAEQGDAEGLFVKLLARAYVEQDANLREFLAERYGDIHRRFFRHMEAALFGLEDTEKARRIDFVIGALTYAMADFGVTRKREPGLQCRDLSVSLVQFALAGLRANID